MKPVSIFFVTAALLAASATSAQEDPTSKESASSENEKAAAIAIEQGRGLHAEGKYVDAAKAFRRAYELRPSWKLFYNIGQCSAAAKQHGAAVEAFEAYLSQGGDEILKDKRDEVIEELRDLKEITGYLEINAPDGAIISIDETPRGKAPLPGPIPVSAAVNLKISVAEDEVVLFERTVRLNAGTTLKVNSNLDSDAASEASIPAGAASQNPPYDTGDETDTAPSPAPRGLIVAGWTAGAVGLAALVGGVATGVSALSINNDLKSRTCIGTSCNEDTQRMEDLQLSTNVLLASGGTIFTAGAAMLIVALVKNKRSRAGDLSLTPVFTPGNSGLVLSASF